ncbi:hypothetical protein ATI61_12438 [Archangium gephyra]|uniref:Uncharacterized protein n=1 Tax=Archangium gephyra TaxID=48 RepID=A0AAC8Q1I1_9BACT|nr:hypothetical protein [Archangium gephyra]AKI99314.1 Hypothetical protein AA314_00941 [Archangium gephyra]REG15453.1 hypothetical protein ATI61_12438 [Archangium gephyra]
MTTPPNSFKTFAMYALGYALTIAALLLDIRYGQAIFALVGFVSSVAVTTHLLYRTARAMAFSPTADRLQPVAVQVTPGGQHLAA